jgi:hypothetical protein
MREPITRTIRGVEYTFYAIPPTIAWPVFVRLQSLLGGSFASVFSDSGAELDATAVARIYREIVQNLTNDDLPRVVQPILGQVMVNGVPVGGTEPRGAALFNNHFAGQYGLLFEVLVVALEVDFGDFFGVLRRALVAAVIEMTDLALQAQVSIQQRVENAQPLSTRLDPTGSSGV